MPISIIVPLALLAAHHFPVATPAPEPETAVAQVASAANPSSIARLTAAWDADVLVLSGLERGTDIRVYDVVGHVLAEFRSESPEARLRLRQRQLVAVCAGGECVGAR